MNILEAILLGIVQGLTEFLPVSSSAHLVLAEYILKIRLESIRFEVFLHLGTFFSVVIIFRQQIWKLIRSLRGIFRKDDSESEEYLKLLGLILGGSVPALVLGLSFNEYMEKAFTSHAFASSMLILTGLFLWFTQFTKAKKDKLNLGDAILVGLAQAFALLPGISRAGFTISTGLFRGVKGEKSAEFSFLLSLPAILGASILKFKEILDESPGSGEIILYLLGGFIAFVFGYIAIKFLLGVLKKGKFQNFAYYCLGVGILSLIFL
ncbi:MAG: undecaprenyl-diphosphate phosphatase [Candidatus Zixiibacteriota bacterium]